MKPVMLITGGTGFLGTSLKEFFTKEGFQTLSLGRNEKNDIQSDISHEVPVFPQLDCVIHASGKAHVVPRTKEEEQIFFDVNVQGTRNICQGLENTEVLPKQFIFVSSVAVYGLDEGEDVDESFPLLGTTPYAKSKIEAENYLIPWAKANNVTLTILRLPLIVGPNPPGNLGAMIAGIKSGKYASIGKADAKKSMIWIEDIPRFILKVKGIGGVYNLTDGYHPTFGELELRISEKLGKPKPLKIPLVIAKILASTGDIIGKRFPFNSEKLKKITASLTFSSKNTSKIAQWIPTKVLTKL
jgi:GlcNAc-P-P-Und epimerase